MMEQEIEIIRQKKLVCSSARLFWEWETIDNRLRNRDEISYRVIERNANGVPVLYEVIFNIRSFCGVMKTDINGIEKPIFASEFIMRINIPNNYPAFDSKVSFIFLTEDDSGKKIPHPWHPNIKFFGDFAGRVCLNTEAFGTFTDLALYIERAASYLRYEKYHANNAAPYPEEQIVAEWILNQAEPNGWIEDFKNNII